MRMRRTLRSWGGSLSEVAAQKICKVMDHAVRTGCPIVGINDSGGARIQEGVDSLHGYAEIFRRNTLASGVVPQITVIAGPAAGGAVYSPAITDFIFMVESIGQMYITGPDVVRAVTGEEVSHEELGGAMSHASRSGVSHFTASDETDCYEAGAVASFVPAFEQHRVTAHASESTDPADRVEEALAAVVPGDSSQSYDVHDVISHIVDDGEFLPVHHRIPPPTS